MNQETFDTNFKPVWLIQILNPNEAGKKWTSKIEPEWTRIFKPLWFWGLLRNDFLLGNWPTPSDLFLKKWKLWAQMKKGERIIEYKTPHHTQGIITKVIDTIRFKFFEITSNIWKKY